MTILTVGLHRSGDASVVFRPGRPEVAARIASQLRQSPTGTTAVRELLTTPPTIFKLAVSCDFGRVRQNAAVSGEVAEWSKAPDC